MKISHTAVDVTYKVSYKTLDYDEIIKKDDNEYESFKKVEVEGKDGKKQITQRITVKDGVEVSREVVDQIITEKAVDEIIRVGTKIRYQTNFKGETRRWKEAPKDGVNGWKSMKVDKITAYCTGTRTATGTTPKLGTIAVNTYYFKYGTQLYVRGYGYGTARSRAELTGRYRKLQLETVLPQLRNGLSALVYTQVSDVEDEVNGLFTYDRQAIKPDPAAVRAVNEALEAEFEKVLKQA